MTAILFPFLIFTGSALSVCYWFRKPFHSTLAVTLLTALFVLYISYIFNALSLGRWLMISVYCLFTIFTAVHALVNRSIRQLIRQYVITPSMLIYAALSVLFLFLSRGKLVGLWDSLRLWGAYPKALHAYGTLQLGTGALLYPIMQSYPPGMPLLGYFFTSFNPVFSESALYFTYAYVGLSLLLPLTGRLTWERWQGILILLFLIVFLPHFIYANDTDYSYYYQSLFIDPTLGLFAGYLFYQVRKNPYRDPFSLWLLSVSLCGITLMKDSGMLFAVSALAAGILGSGILQKGIRNRHTVVSILIPVVLLSFVSLSWKYLLAAFTVHNHVPIGTPSLLAFGITVKQFFITSVGIDLRIASLAVSYGGIFILFIAVYALYLYRDKALLTADRWVLLARVFAYILFVIGYVSIFSAYIEKHELLSFSRYMGTLLLCEAYLFVAMLIEKNEQTGTTFLARPYRSLSGFEKKLAAVLCLILLLFSVYTIHNFRKMESAVYQPAEAAAVDLTNSIQEKVAQPDIRNVYLLIGGDALGNSLLHHRIYFDLIDKHIRVKNFYTETDITQSGLAYTPGKFLALLKEQGFDYVYILNADTPIVTEFSEIFPSVAVDPSRDFLYRVVNTEDTTALEPISMR